MPSRASVAVDVLPAHRASRRTRDAHNRAEHTAKGRDGLFVRACFLLKLPNTLLPVTTRETRTIRHGKMNVNKRTFDVLSCVRVCVYVWVDRFVYWVSQTSNRAMRTKAIRRCVYVYVCVGLDYFILKQNRYFSALEAGGVN